MVEEIITALSRIRWLFVIARNSSFTYKGQAVDVKRVGRELGVRYVLEGSVRKGGNRVRITAQLIEAETGAHLWADRFDGALEDVFDLQDQVAISVAGVIEPALQAAETARAAARPTADLDRLRAVPARAGDLFPDHPRQGAGGDGPAGAGDRDATRDYGPALVLGGCSATGNALPTAGPRRRRRTRDRAIELARRALEVTRSDDPGVLANAAFILANFGEEIGAMIGLIDRALASIRASHGAGTSARCCGCTPANSTARSSMPGPPCA